MRPAEILLIEDDAGHARLTQEAFREGRLEKHIHVVSNGEAAMEFLRRAGSYADAPRPDLILLDLKLPKKNGREVLSEIKADKALAKIPTVVFTTSESEQDIYDAYRLKANCYIAKPIDLSQYLSTIAAIERFWLRLDSAV